MARGLLASLLAGLVFACPLLCVADATGHASRHEAVPGDTEGDHLPDQCPEGGDNCVCRGAVRAHVARADAPDTISVGSFHLPGAQAYFDPLIHHLAPGGSLPSLAGWGDALTVRAHLQNFRF